MTLLDLIPDLKKISTTNGSEWAGPCPFCGGNDRFRVWPSEGPTGRYWCRSCSKSGDGLQFLRDLQGLTFPEALKAWGLPPLTWKPGPPATKSTIYTWEPREAKAPGTTWTDRAGAFLEKCQSNLWGPSGAKCRAFLTDRGLKPETVKRVGLGWNIADA